MAVKIVMMLVMMMKLMCTSIGVEKLLKQR
jgi:hypothetical protein